MSVEAELIHAAIEAVGDRHEIPAEPVERIRAKLADFLPGELIALRHACIFLNECVTDEIRRRHA